MTVRIHHINCGTLCPACERLINGHGSWTGPARLVCHCLLIETGKELVLVDTGLGTDDVKQAKSRLGAPFVAMTRPRLDLAETAVEQVKALGYQPDDVRHIIPTHLDLDHAGGLPDFPGASVHVYKPELQAALHPSLREKLRYLPQHFSHGPKWVQHEEENENWFGFRGIRPIPGLDIDILLVPLIGHTRGHVGVAVKNGNKWVLHAGDAYFHHSTLDAEPNMPPGLAMFEKVVQTDSATRLWNQQRLRDLKANHGDEVEIFCAHDPVEFDRYSSKVSSFYTSAPASGSEEAQQKEARL